MFPVIFPLTLWEGKGKTWWKTFMVKTWENMVPVTNGVKLILQR